MENKNGIESRPVLDPLGDDTFEDIKTDEQLEEEKKAQQQAQKEEEERNRPPQRKEVEGGGSSDDDDTPTGDDDVEVYRVKKDQEASSETDDEGKTDAFYIGQMWKEKGYLPEDVEIQDDITMDQLDEVYRSQREKPIFEQVQQDFFQNLQEQGITERNLRVAKMIEGGINKEEISEIEAYRQLGQEDLSGEDNKEKREEVIRTYYIQGRGFSEDKADKWVERVLYNEEDEEEAKEAQEFFKNHAQQLEKQKEELAQKRIEENNRRKKERRETIKNLLEKEEINGVKYSQAQREKAKKRIFGRTETIPDGKGGKIPVSYYQKKLWEMQQNPELEFENILNIVLDFNVESFKEKADSRAAKKIIDKYAGKARKMVENPEDLTEEDIKKGNVKIEKRALT